MIGSQARKPVLCKTGVDIINKKMLFNRREKAAEH